MPATDRTPPLIVLGFDWGTQKIGVAVGQSVTATATPLAPLGANQGIPDWTEVKQVVDRWQPDLLIVGIPLNMDGSESDSSRLARKFGRRLAGRFSIPWMGMDERLSTFEVRQEARLAGVQPPSIDSLAAKVIVESWLREQSASSI